MTEKEYAKMINNLCQVSWNKNQKKRYGNWDSQPDKIKSHYYKALYDSYVDLYLGDV